MSMSSLGAPRRVVMAALVVAGTALAGLTGAAPAFAEAPSWKITSEVAPTFLSPGGEGTIALMVSNLGNGTVDASKSKVNITDTLPAVLNAVKITGFAAGGKTSGGEALACSTLPTNGFTCTYTGLLAPYEELRVYASVQVEEPAGTNTELVNAVQVEGGGAPTVSSTEPVKISGEPVPFGVQRYDVSPLNENGTPDTHAGSHPFELATTLVLNQATEHGEQRLAGLPKDLSFVLPPGFVGNPTAVEPCTTADFTAALRELNLCAPSSAIGVALVLIYEPYVLHLTTRLVPVFNLVPAQGEPARFGFKVYNVPVVLDTSVRTGGGYNVVASVNDAPQSAGLLSSQVTLWGVPGDPRHDSSRGWECIGGENFLKEVGRRCPTSSEEPQQPFLTLPTSCASNPREEPLSFSMEADSWAEPEDLITIPYTWSSPSGEPLALDGCSQLPFTPTLDVSPEVHGASRPTGLSVNVQVPQKATLEAERLAEADVRDTTVTLPEGVPLSPSAANGLEACSEEQIGYKRVNPHTQMQEFTAAKPACPEAAKVGTVHVSTPLLSHELEGALYVATPAPNGEARQNPFNSLLAVYLVAEDPVSGVLVKLAGEAKLNESTGRLSTTFTNTPQLPFEDLKIDLFGGERASVTTPPTCGDYGTEAAFTPWSGTGTVDLSSPLEEFRITEGCVGNPLPFSPGFDAQSTNVSAGAFTSFALEIVRPDSDQALTGLKVHLPPGVAALLSSVTPCQEPPVGRNGHVVLKALLATPRPARPGQRTVHAGREGLSDQRPTTARRSGLLAATEAKAGPFNLGMVDVRSRIDVDPNTSAVTIATDPGLK